MSKTTPPTDEEYGIINAIDDQNVRLILRIEDREYLNVSFAMLALTARHMRVNQPYVLRAMYALRDDQRRLVRKVHMCEIQVNDCPDPSYSPRVLRQLFRGLR